MSRYGKRRGRGWLFGRFYINPAAQYSTTVIAAIIFAGFVFSGFLLFRYTDRDDLITRGKRMMEEGKVAWAAKTFQTLVSNHPNSYEAHLLLGKSYLELGERQKAEQEFRTASALRSTEHPGSEADIAMSQFNIARKEFELAEEKLKAAAKEDPQNPELRQALYELYDSWGDALISTDKDYQTAITKYERALRFVQEYRLEDKLKEKLINAITVQADRLNVQKNYEGAIQLLKKSLRYRYLPDTLIEIAEAHEKAGQLDESIYWYRKAFDTNPSIISIKLSNMLIKKGKKLLEEKKPEEAERLFAEARQVSESANVPIETLFPVKTEGMKVTSSVDEETGEFLPTVSVKLENAGARQINFLMAKTTFYSGDKVIGEASQVVASPSDPLFARGEKKSHRALTLKPESQLNVNLLVARRLRVKLAVAYTEGDAAQWKELALQEVILQEGKAAKPEIEDADSTDG